MRTKHHRWNPAPPPVHREVPASLAWFTTALLSGDVPADHRAEFDAWAASRAARWEAFQASIRAEAIVYRMYDDDLPF